MMQYQFVNKQKHNKHTKKFFTTQLLSHRQQLSRTSTHLIILKSNKSGDLTEKANPALLCYAMLRNSLHT